MSRSALINGGVPAFMVLLVLLLATSLVAVIRLPRRAGSPPDDDTRDEPGHPGPGPRSRYPAAGNAGRCAIRSVSVPASATGQSGEPDYPARHVTGTAGSSGQDTPNPGVARNHPSRVT